MFNLFGKKEHKCTVYVLDFQRKRGVAKCVFKESDNPRTTENNIREIKRLAELHNRRSKWR